jgi:hypothetical protein
MTNDNYHPPDKPETASDATSVSNSHFCNGGRPPWQGELFDILPTNAAEEFLLILLAV